MPSRAEQRLVGARRVVLEQHDEHVARAELVDRAAGEVAHAGRQRDRRHVHHRVVVSPAARAVRRLPSRATSPADGRRNTRPSQPAGRVTSMPWAARSVIGCAPGSGRLGAGQRVEARVAGPDAGGEQVAVGAGLALRRRRAACRGAPPSCCPCGRACRRRRARCAAATAPGPTRWPRPRR